MKLIYVASPYAGEVKQNIKFAELACRMVMNRGHAFFAPHLIYPHFLNDDDPLQRQTGQDMGLAVLEKCDELWVFGDRISPGMEREIQKAESLGIPSVHIPALDCEEQAVTEVADLRMR